MNADVMATSDTLDAFGKKLSEPKIWRKGDQRAPHKPLLLLYVLSNYKRGHGRLFDYGTEIHEPLLSLLEHYGPTRRQHEPTMPFWRLRGDGFWELENAELCSTTGSKEPPRRELFDHKVAGGFDVNHFALIDENRAVIDVLATQILEKHFPVGIQQTLADELGFDIVLSLKQRDPAFRLNVLRAYNYRCAICGFDMRHDNAPIALEAAHIRWKQFNGPCEVPNGLALCAIHHNAFDRGAIGLDSDMRVVVSEGVNGNGMVQKLFWDFAGEEIELPKAAENYPREAFVEWHRREVFRG